MNIQELIARIKQRPAMYIGEPTLSRFEAFLLGWLFANADESDRKFIQGFQEWIAERYGIKSSHSWASIIRFYAKDDISALGDAIELIGEYVAKHEVKH